MFKTLVTPLVLALCLATGAASAATIRESEAGEFSGDWGAATVIGAGATSVAGRWSFQNDYDILSLAFLPAGKQILTLVFEAVPGFGDSYSAGGQVLFSTSAFRWGWDGTYVAGGVNFGAYNAGTPITRTIELGDDFGGQLWLGLYGTHSNPLTYNIFSSAALPSSAALSSGTVTAPSAVPLPAGLVLLLTALGGLGAMALRRRRRLAPPA